VRSRGTPCGDRRDRTVRSLNVEAPFIRCARNCETERLVNVARLSRMDPIVQALHEIARAQQTSFLPQRLVDWAQVVLVFFTGLTLYFLWKYTAETVELRKATRDQVEVSNHLLQTTQEQAAVSNRLLTEAQIQNTTAIRPILEVVPTGVSRDRTIGDRVYRFFDQAVRNVGYGPAFNPQFDAVELGTGEIIRLYAPQTIPATATIPVAVKIGTGTAPPGDLIGLLNVLVKAGLSDPIEVTLRYRDASGALYRTRHRIVSGGPYIFFEFRYEESGSDAVAVA
jgi:hypothetical protein